MKPATLVRTPVTKVAVQRRRRRTTHAAAHSKQLGAHHAPVEQRTGQTAPDTFQHLEEPFLAEGPVDHPHTLELPCDKANLRQAELRLPDGRQPGEPMVVESPAQNEAQLVVPALDNATLAAPAECPAVPEALTETTEEHKPEWLPSDAPQPGEPIIFEPPAQSEPQLAVPALAEATLAAPAESPAACEATFGTNQWHQTELRLTEEPQGGEPLVLMQTANAGTEPGSPIVCVTTEEAQTEDQLAREPQTTTPSDFQAELQLFAEAQPEASFEPIPPLEPWKRALAEEALDLAASFEECSPEAPLQRDRQAENVAEIFWGGRQIVNLDGQGEEPTVLEPLTKKKVLVIDDDPVLRMLLKMGLEPHGYDCVTAENGREAQAVFAASCPELILVDLLMPVMDGLAFIHWLRQTAHNSTPVLALTNIDDPRITQEALRSGANACACKPLHLRDLLHALEELVPA